MERAIIEALATLNANIARLAAYRVPPPAIYNGSSDFEVFIRQYEAYCTSIYGEHPNSWLQMLPSFTDGEPRCIVQAYGMNQTVTYAKVKERLRTECQRRALGTNAITDLFSATRRLSESLLCYSIRLQALAEKIPGMTAQNKALIVQTKFLKPSFHQGG